MERPSAKTIAYYDAAVPADSRAQRGQMFGHPCAFVNGNMFFGTFHQSIVARVGTERASALAKGNLRIFEPMPGRLWREYIQVDAGTLPAAKIAALAAEALDWTDQLPAKKGKDRPATAVKKTPAAKTAARKAPAAKTAARKAPAAKTAARKAPAMKTAAKKK